MGEVRVLPVAVTGVRLADAITAFLATIGPANTRRGYAAALNRMRQDFGMDADTARLDPDRVAGWFTFVWGHSTPQPYNVRLAGLRKAFGYWREQRWLTDDPLTRLRARPVALDDSRALTRAQIAELLGLNARLRERVLWQMLFENRRPRRGTADARRAAPGHGEPARGGDPQGRGAGSHRVADRHRPAAAQAAVRP